MQELSPPDMMKWELTIAKATLLDQRQQELKEEKAENQ
jgi:hypothetical protein